MESIEKSMTRVLKPLMKNKKKISKITKYYDYEEKKTVYRLYLKQGCVNEYDWKEVDYTDYSTEEKELSIIAHELDEWFNEIIMSDEVLKECMDGIKKGEFKEIQWLD